MVMSNNTIKRKVISFSYISNLNKSILLINPIIEKEGYKFRIFSFKEFEEKFSDLVNLSKKFNKTYSEKITDKNETISNELIHLILQNPYFGNKPLINGEIIFLQKIDCDIELIKNNTVTPNFKGFEKLRLFTEDIVLKLRLFKGGDIKPIMQFQIGKEDNNITSRLYQNIEFVSIKQEFILNKNEINNFEDFYNQNFSENKLTKFAISNFELSYDVKYENLKFITLMTSLESLFNYNKQLIAHTVSRHLSIIVSNNLDEFNVNYDKFKKLYTLRNDIVHGNIIKENVHKKNIELQSLVREAIIKCSKLAKNKEKLFGILNSKGFIETNKQLNS